MLWDDDEEQYDFSQGVGLDRYRFGGEDPGFLRGPREDPGEDSGFLRGPRSDLGSDPAFFRPLEPGGSEYDFANAGAEDAPSATLEPVPPPAVATTPRATASQAPATVAPPPDLGRGAAPTPDSVRPPRPSFGFGTNDLLSVRNRQTGATEQVERRRFSSYEHELLGAPTRDPLSRTTFSASRRYPTDDTADESRPLDMVVRLAGKGPSFAADVRRGVADLIQGNARGSWAEPYLNDVARFAWTKEERAAGRNVDPNDAPVSYIESWKDGFFGSDTSVPLVKEIDQQLIDYAARQGPTPTGAFDWKTAFGPNGESGLISRQVASNDCGPNAFSTVLRSHGYNLDPAEAFGFARRRGYHDGEQFTGPQNMARMLTEEAGVKSRATPLDWGVVDRELDAGRVVLLSSGGHYWALSARRAGDRGTEYYAGSTASVVGNPEWGVSGAFRYGGAPDTMIVQSSGADVDPTSRVVSQLGLKPPTGAESPSAPDRRLLSRLTPKTLAEREAMEGRDDWYMPPKEKLGRKLVSDMNAGRIRTAAAENYWEANPTRQGLMTEFQKLPYEERQRAFDEAMLQAAIEEGIPEQEQGRWVQAMRQVVTGQGLSVPGENPDLNPYMLAGESGGRPGDANRLNSSALGYFQFLRQNPDGSLYSHDQYIPDEYKQNPFDPVGQGRQFIRAIKASGKHKGDPMSVVREKNDTKVWGP